MFDSSSWSDEPHQDPQIYLPWINQSKLQRFPVLQRNGTKQGDVLCPA